MAQQHINLGTPPSGVDGDTDRAAWVKAEANFTDLYAAFGGQSPAEVVAQVEQNTADIATMKPQVATNVTNISALQTNDSTQDGRLTAVEGKNTAQDASIAANTAALASINPVGAFKNKLINGNFDFWQRGTPLAITADGSTFGPDRWFINANRDGGSYQAGAAWARQSFAIGQSIVPNNPTFFPAAYATINGGGGNAYWAVGQKIEGVRTYAGQKITLSFYADCSIARTAVVQAVQDFGTGGSPSATVRFGNQIINMGGGWRKITLTFDVPSITGKTLGSNGNDNLSIYIWMQAGATVGASVGVGTIADPGSTIWLSQCQLEQGANATPFELRPLAAELALCQRYYEKTYPQNAFPGTVAARGHPPFISWLAAASNSQTVLWTYKVTKRATPTIVTYDDAGTAGRCSYLNSGAWSDGGGVTAAYTSDMACATIYNNLQASISQIEVHLTADAEI